MRSSREDQLRLQASFLASGGRIFNNLHDPNPYILGLFDNSRASNSGIRSLFEEQPSRSIGASIFSIYLSTKSQNPAIDDLTKKINNIKETVV